jgi:hypothetical protein
MSNLVDPKYTDPKSWGPHFWFMMFCIANNYPENPTNTDRNVTHGFFSNMQRSLYRIFQIISNHS